MNCLVTGAAGFIGQSLAAKLASEGHNIVGIDNLNNYYDIELKKYRLAELCEFPNFKFFEVDLVDLKNVSKIFMKLKIDRVFHLAAQAGVRLNKNQFNKYVDSNISSFTNILRLSTEYNIPDFVYASSSSVYGDAPERILSEQKTLLRPNSYYGATKIFNEHAARTITLNSNTRTRCLRYFTVYGPKGRPDMAYFRIISALLNDDTFALFGDGMVSRDFTYIDDAVKATIELANQLNTLNTGYSDVVNVGGGNPVSILKMIEIAENLVGCKLKILKKESIAQDVLHTEASTDFLEGLIGSHPQISLEKGLENVLNWAKTPNIRIKLNKWIATSI